MLKVLSVLIMFWLFCFYHKEDKIQNVNMIFSGICDLALNCHCHLISYLVTQHILQVLAVYQRYIKCHNGIGQVQPCMQTLNIPSIERAAIFFLFLMPVPWIFLETSTCTSCMYLYRFMTLSAPKPCTALSFCLSVPLSF